MDLRLNGSKAILCASSRGLGLACATALVAEGVHVLLNGRDPDVLARAAAELAAKSAGTVTPVAGDVTPKAGRAALLAAGRSTPRRNAGGGPFHFTESMLCKRLLVRAILIGDVRAPRSQGESSTISRGGV
jgi:3-oxoacyl-[acyl-carrier protein] reductase